MIPVLSATTTYCDVDSFYNTIMNEDIRILSQDGTDILYSYWNGKKYDIYILFNTVSYLSELPSIDYEKVLAEVKRGTTIEEICSMLDLPA